ncbi:Hypothetical protein DIP0367 [Corynebacterium diphtheriae]|uniref:Uncharacterized protein n=1 Tax=Corynebacterium diphtheriae (strain ATCC 700971 / NCTC 13129 / Biotype gravis) TaxID=257309 RepID=Q6NJN1_CORDI|nr:Hypothetical protein DIP0367 [Corynebacterium diphtheriae]
MPSAQIKQKDGLPRSVAFGVGHWCSDLSEESQKVENKAQSGRSRVAKSTENAGDCKDNLIHGKRTPYLTWVSAFHCDVTQVNQSSLL